MDAARGKLPQHAWQGQEVAFAHPAVATAAGIVCIFQERSLIPDLSVADNILISSPPKRRGMIDHRAQLAMARAALRRAATSIRARSSRTCPCRGARSWRSPRRWPASHGC